MGTSQLAQQYARGAPDPHNLDVTTRPTGAGAAPPAAPVSSGAASHLMANMSLGARSGNEIVGGGGFAAPRTVLNPSGTRTIGSRDVSKVSK